MTTISGPDLAVANHLDTLGRDGIVGVRKYPQMGDVSCRTALTIHRGTAHGSPVARPVLILGVVRGVVDEVEPITQRHDIEGLVMGVE